MSCTPHSRVPASNVPLIRALRDARLASATNQISLTQTIGVSANIISHWESGRHEPRLSLLIAWANALGFDVTLTPRTRT